MSRKIDFDKPLSDEDKAYLRSRGSSQASKIIANERRFGSDGTRVPSPYESEGEPADSASFDTDVRNDALYDVGGAPLPGTVLDKDTGRVVPLSARSEFPSTDDNGDSFDEDIIAYVEELKVAELKAELKEKFPAVEIESDDKKEDLQDKLIIALQDQRNEANKASEASAQQSADDLAGDFGQPLEPVSENDDSEGKGSE